MKLGYLSFILIKLINTFSESKQLRKLTLIQNKKNLFNCWIKIVIAKFVILIEIKIKTKSSAFKQIRKYK